MTAFQFPLQKVLDWRRTQLDLEEARYKQQAAALAELDRIRGEIETAGANAEAEVRSGGQVQGRDLAAGCLHGRRHARQRGHPQIRDMPPEKRTTHCAARIQKEADPPTPLPR